MDVIGQGLLRAARLIVNLDAELAGIVVLSLAISGLALATATVFGLAAASVLAFARFPGRSLTITVLNTLMGLPPVVVGLFLYLVLSRSGPLGFLGLLYTPKAMILAQAVLAFPIVASLCHSAIVNVDPIIRQSALALGASPFQAGLAVVREARYGVLSSVIAAFGRVTAEVGAVLIVGGNIAGLTRVMTTAIALETDKGNFELALALGLILLTLSLLINFGFRAVQRYGPARRAE